MSIAKKIRDMVEKDLQRTHSNNVSICFGKLNKHTLTALQEYFIVKESFFGYYDFKRKAA